MNWCFWVVLLEKILESALDSKEIKSVNPKGNQAWIFSGRTDVEAEAPMLWPLDVKSLLIGKDRDAGKDWGQKKGMTEDEMVGWHQWLSGHEFEQGPGIGDGQGSLVCCSSSTTKSRTQLSNWTELISNFSFSLARSQKGLWLTNASQHEGRCDCRNPRWKAAAG